MATNFGKKVDMENLIAFYDPSDVKGFTSGDSTITERFGGYSGVFANQADYKMTDYGPSFTFDGTNDYIDLGDGPYPEMTGGFTVETWFRTNTLSNSYGYITSNARDCCGSYKGMEMRVTNDDLQLQIWNSDQSNQSTLNYSNCLTSTGTNYHFAVSFDNDDGTMKIYLDGQLGASRTISDTLPPDPSYNMYIGRMGHGNYEFNGDIYYVKYYDAPLSDAKILEHYNDSKKFYK